MASLYEIRTDINNQDQSSLMDQLKNARSGREGWWNQRWAAHWSLEETAPSVEMPTAKDMMGRMVGLRRSKEEKKDK
jgi:hypothetical protein